MKIHQLSLFVENKPGGLVAPCRVLAEHGVNIVTLSLADTGQFGILRLIVQGWQAARDALKSAGFLVTVTDVVAVEVDDRPGGIAALLEPLAAAGLTLEYMYAFAGRRGEKAVICVRFEDVDRAIVVLEQAGIPSVVPVELQADAELDAAKS